jgi:hypothetical protein
MTLTQARAICDEWLPTTAPNYATIRDRSIKMAVQIAAPRVDEQTYQDFTAKDAVTTRYAITGRDVRPMQEQDAPTNVNTAGVAAPTAAPSLTGTGAGGTFAVGLWYAGYAYNTTLGQTTMSPLGTVTLTAAQSILTGALTLPLHVNSVDWFVGTQEFNAVVQSKSGFTGVTGAAKTITAPAVAGTGPLINYTPLSSLAPGLYEAGVAVDGTALSTVTTLNLGTAPAAGAKFRVNFSRIATPPVNPTDVIGLPDEWMTWVAPWLCCQGLALSHQGGDATRFQQVAQELQPFVQDFLARSTGRQIPKINWTSWSVT